MKRRAGIHARQSPHAFGEMEISIGPIDHPPAIALCGAGCKTETPVVIGQIGVFHADEMEFSGGGKSWQRSLARAHASAAATSEAASALGHRRHSDYQQCGNNQSENSPCFVHGIFSFHR